MKEMIVKKRKDIVHFDFLNLDVAIVYGKKRIKYFTKKNDIIDQELMSEIILDNGRSCIFENDGVLFFVIFFMNTEFNIVVHECVHMVHQICNAKGIPISLDNSETIAYMTQFLVKKVWGIVG